ncbi:uncharacterized protein LOC108917849 [Anoplophora glabripennis]|uniref:uncharacterized protein LOC108917849 n=1 Tax=Anoplophora glabripennis TaxID=217634 RepID=UPI000874F151|nr:uncharacterized protein LOC108917849 [Anoplophora glabripennis]
MGDIDCSFWVRPFQVMEWSSEASLALIDEYKRHPVLWDSRHQSYSSKVQKQEAWEDIALNMQMDLLEVKQKMNSLLGSFRREKSRMRRVKEGSSVYCSKWFAFEKMQFLLREDETDSLGIKLEDEEDSIFDELRFPLNEPQETVPSDKRASTGYASPLRRAKKLLKPVPADPVIEDLSIFPQDEYAAFGNYIACKLRKFDPRSRAFVEHAINNILFEADMGKYDNMPTPSQEALASLNDIANN